MSLKLPFIEDEIIDQYLYDDNPRPWIIGFSGGKDSTMLLQVVWNALKKIPDGTRDRPIYVVCNDTLVENPKIVSFINRTLERVQKAAAEQGLPITVHRTTPRLEDTFWVNLLGRGYPAPNNTFQVVYGTAQNQSNYALYSGENQRERRGYYTARYPLGGKSDACPFHETTRYENRAVT